MTTISSEMRLYAPSGARLYINEDERRRFIEAAQKALPNIRSLCLILAYTGCRISEALMLTTTSIQVEACVISIKTLKQRRKDRFVIREVPVPKDLIDILMANVTIDVLDRYHSRVLFPVCRETAWRQVKTVMEQAGISGPQATAKGLRHGYGIWAQHAGVPLNMIQKWMGHARIETTAIYTKATGPEERAIAGRMWG